jgi:hypothetical protein
VVVVLSDVDELLGTTSSLEVSTPVQRLRSWRDEFAHIAVLLSYARHVLSVDVEVLQSIDEDPGRDLQALVNDLPRLLATASIGGGWSLSPDALTTMRSANQALEGEADALLSVHSRLALIDLHSHEEVARTVNELKAQMGVVTDHLQSVENRLREIRALLVEQYKSGAANADDWVL